MLKKIITSLVYVALLVFVSNGEKEKDLLLVKREKRTSVVSTEYGDISSVNLINGSYLLHFFTFDPNSLFLPVILHADMLFYVHTGSGRLSWTEENGGDLKRTDLSRGDVYRLQEGSVFFIQSNLETQRQKLRIHALFHNPDQKHTLLEPLVRRPYSSIRDMVLGFDKKVLQASFNVPEQVIDELLNGTKQPAIVHGVPRTKRSFTRELEAQFIRGFFGSKSYHIFESNKKKKGGAKLFNIFNEDKDFENGNGWSTTVTRKKLSSLKGSNIGLFMVNLTAGSMMGPHWNPLATEIAIVLQGRGMVQVVCSDDVSNETLCRNTRFEVEVGDVFVVPRFNIMAQMAFNNDTFAFMGFTTSSKINHPQYIAGQASVLRTLDKDVLAQSFDVSNTTILDRILAEQRDSVILECTSCAEEVLRVVQEEVEKEREEAREREEEETRKREEERRKEEEEETRKREEERRKEEEETAERKRQEEAAARKREEEEAQRQEEERKKREEEEEARKREEERRKEEEEAAERKREEEEAARRREEEEARRQEEERIKREEEEETRKREEEAAARKREEEEARKREEEEAAQRREEERKTREEEEAEAAKEAEETKRREEAAAKARSAEEERQRQAQAAAKKAEEERQEREAEAAAEEERKMEEEAQKEEEAAREEERERERREQSGGEGLILKKRLTV